MSPHSIWWMLAWSRVWPLFHGSFLSAFSWLLPAGWRCHGSIPLLLVNQPAQMICSSYSLRTMAGWTISWKHPLSWKQNWEHFRSICKDFFVTKSGQANYTEWLSPKGSREMKSISIYVASKDQAAVGIWQAGGQYCGLDCSCDGCHHLSSVSCWQYLLYCFRLWQA